MIKRLRAWKTAWWADPLHQALAVGLFVFFGYSAVWFWPWLVVSIAPLVALYGACWVVGALAAMGWRAMGWARPRWVVWLFRKDAREHAAA